MKTPLPLIFLRAFGLVVMLAGAFYMGVAPTVEGTIAGFVIVLSGAVMWGAAS